MLQAKIGKEIVVKIKNEIDSLAEISKIFADKGISVDALTINVCGDECVNRFITDDNLRASEALTKKLYSPTEENVILIEMPHKAGMLRKISETLAAEQINILHAYAAASSDQEKCLLSLHTSNDETAFLRLNKMKLS